MAETSVTELQKSHLIELLFELKELANSFILIGGQALPYITKSPRTTKDIDFILDVYDLRETDKSIADVLSRLNYIPKEHYFQFEKEISPELKIRIEFLASEREQRTNNIRVDIQDNIHARSCTGAEIVVRESYLKTLNGFLPNGQPAEVKIRVVKAHALLMLKLLAMDDRYRNLRGPDEYEHDRDEARVHAADTVKIVHEHIQNPDFVKSFWTQFKADKDLKDRCYAIIKDRYQDKIANSIGIILYEEFLKSQGEDYSQADLERALREIRLIGISEGTKNG
jgi:hypothetical protein